MAQSLSWRDEIKLMATLCMDRQERGDARTDDEPWSDQFPTILMTAGIGTLLVAGLALSIDFGALASQWFAGLQEMMRELESLLFYLARG